MFKRALDDCRGFAALVICDMFASAGRTIFARDRGDKRFASGDPNRRILPVTGTERTVAYGEASRRPDRHFDEAAERLIPMT